MYRTSAGRSRLSHGSRRWSASPYPGPLVEIRFHELRHTAGTLALRQGVPLPTVSKMPGHSDPAMTVRRYAHVLEDMREDAAQAMDELF